MASYNAYGIGILTVALGSCLAGSIGSLIYDAYVTHAPVATEFIEAAIVPSLLSIGAIVAWTLIIAHFTWKPDHHAALALDRIQRGGRSSSVAHDSPFLAFIERARQHLSFIGTGFADGAAGRYLGA